MKGERVIYADILRILATFSVIILHVAARNWYSIPLHTMEWQVLNIYDSFVRWCVPIFLMLSGMFFLDPEKKITTKAIYYKYILRILIALVFWGIVYSVYSYQISSQQSEQIDYVQLIKYIAVKLIFGHPWHHLWFLYTIIGIYVITPFLRNFSRHWTKKELEYFLLVYTILGPFITPAGILVSGMGKFPNVIFKIVELAGYLGYFVAGYYFSKFVINRLVKQFIFSLAGLSIILTIIGTYMLSISIGKPNEFFYEYFSMNTMFISYAVFILIREKINKFEFNTNTIRLIEYISSCTFGIYLIHEIFIEIFKNIEIDSLSFNPIFSVPLLAAVNFLLSLTVIAIIKKIPWFNKRII